MIDFSNCLEVINGYSGSEKKKTLIYNEKKYLVKFPDPVRELKKEISYINNAYSEYVGSNIFSLIGISVQNTILGEYNYKEKKKIVCACEDFTDDVNKLYEFENLALSINTDKKIGTEVKDIMEVIDNCNIVDKNDTKIKFWDMFIVDSLIGSTDRHNGNWGFLVNVLDNSISFSPIYDCGSCLNPLFEDSDISKFSRSDIKNLAVNCYSVLKEKGKRINYINYISKGTNKDCTLALLRVFPKIDIEI